MSINPEHANLAQLLRECASLVERNEHSALLYKAVEALNRYAETTGHIDSSTKVSRRLSFQRPKNTKSTLIANGWLEQNRKSRFRNVWKEVLASLVEGSREGEETTLWIQRERIVNGKTTLEALHQIPMKWMLDVKMLEFYGEYRFAITVYNVPEDFIFRTRGEESCREWIATLKSAKESGKVDKASKAAKETEFPDLLNEKKSNGGTGDKLFPDLNMENGQPEPSAPPMPENSSRTSSSSSHGHENGMRNEANSQQTNKASGRKTIAELRAIAHGAGYDTRGMERADLEKIAAYFAPVSERNAAVQSNQKSVQETQQERTTRIQKEIEERRKAEEAERLRKQQEDERIRQQQQYVQQKREEAKQRQEAVRKQAEEAKRRQQQQQQQEQWLPQQQWKNSTQASSSPRRRQPVGGMNQFESTRFFGSNNHTQAGESGPRRKYPGHTANQPNQAGTQQQSVPSSQQPFKAPQYHQPQGRPQQQYPQQQQQQPQQTYQRQPPPQPQAQQQSQPQQTYTTPGENQRTKDPTSPLNQKYAKAMGSDQESGQDDDAIIAVVKRNVLMTWALVPPQYNMLRPIDQLLSSIQTVLPPFGGVASHDYFAKWKPINHQDLLIGAAMTGPDEAKLKKAVRKLRVFLHPDRLPKEFDAKQTFVCKMLWDVSNDAYEEFLKNKDELEWIRS